MSAAVDEGVGTRAQDAAWWEMEVPCESSQPCPPRSAAWRYARNCGCVWLLCEEHNRRIRKVNTREAICYHTWACSMCGRRYQPHRSVWAPL